MPKSAKYTLTWDARRAAYALHDGDAGQSVPMSAARLGAWMEGHSSLAFRGQAGQLNLLFEQRKGGAGYWYAYRRSGKRVAKRYAGRSGEITFERLEELARLLGDNAQTSFVPQTSDGVMPTEASITDASESEPAGETILAPKLQLPRLHSSLVHRGRLLARLDAGRESKLALVSAPAGFGKTTLVRQWLADLAKRGVSPAVAWLSLDRGDNDPVRFWRYLIAACGELGPGVGAKSLSLLDGPMSLRSPLEATLAAFVNEVAQVGESLLVLEDYHAITSPQINETVGFLLDHLPANLHIVIISRTEPPPALPLARLRAAGEITEIDVFDLRFSASETAAFLHGSIDGDLSDRAVTEVESHVEGWAAGLRLLALALEGKHRSRDEIEGVLAHFMSGPHQLQDYFASEVLDNQPESVQLFLLQTSFLRSLNASLCDAVTGLDNGQEMLDALDRANLFIEPLDASGLCYRYHALFAVAMQGETRRRLGEGAMRDLMRRARAWYRRQDMMGDAIELAFAGGDMLAAANLVEEVAERQFSFSASEMHLTPEFHTMQRWLRQIPEYITAERPLLYLAHATAVLFTYIMEMRPPPSDVGVEIERLLAKADSGFRSSGETGRLGQTLAFRSLLVRERGQVAEAVALAKAAINLLPEQELTWRNVCLSNMGIGAADEGHMREAAELFRAAYDICLARTFARANLGMMAGVMSEQGQLHHAATQFQQMHVEAREQGDLDDIGHTLQALADLEYEWNDLDAAWQNASEVLEATRLFPHEPYHIAAVLLLARIEHARGDTEAALSRLGVLRASRPAPLWPADMQLARMIEAAQVDIALSSGDLAFAQRWRASRNENLHLPIVQHDRENVLLARLMLAEGESGAAIRLLEPLLEAADEDGRGRAALEMRVQLSLAYASCGQLGRARQTLTDALEFARPESFRRTFLDAGEQMAILLRSTLPTLADKHLLPYAKGLMRAFMAGLAQESSALVEALSAQERRVLRLMAEGRSNAEIATQLVVSINTVKAHAKNIYSKLNVASRVEAAAAAREMQLV